MKQQWYTQNKKADFERLAQRFGLSPVTIRLIRNRGPETDAAFEKYLHGSIRDLYNPWDMKDMEKAVSLIRETIAGGKKIRVIGDYDIDGVCASFILKEMLQAAGACADVDIPHRVKDGYGVSRRLMEKAKEDGAALVITCDNGISAREAIHYAKEAGLTVIVTDHHEVPFEENAGGSCDILPEADAVIDPKRTDCPYPFPGLCGAGVAFKLGQALLETLAVEQRQALYEELLCFCAFATIGDIMELKDENRILVKEGLRHFPDLKNVGLRALIAVNQLDPAHLTPEQIGFILGPCINAAGRLDSAMLAYGLFNETDENAALAQALHLKELNDQRKTLTQEGLERAVALAEQEPETPVLFLYVKEIHESVAGIIAGRLRELYNKPAFVLTDSGGLLKGAGRSIEAYPMFDRLQACGELFSKFGGHKMAAGFSLPPENFEKAKDFLNAHCGLTAEDFVQKVSVDFQMSPSYITMDLLEEIRQLAPFGNGNPEPCFAERDLKVTGYRLVGEMKNVLSLDFEQNGRPMKGVCFRDAEALAEELKRSDTLTMVYRPQLNEYRGTVSVQLVVEYFANRQEADSNSN